MKLDYLDVRMADGSRLFTVLPGVISWPQIREHLVTLPEVQLGQFLTDEVTEAWLDFTYLGQAFVIHDTMGEYNVFAEDGNCSSLILTYLMEHFRLLEAPGE